MKAFFRLLPIALVALGLALPARADEPAHPAKPMLWKVEGQGLEKPSWLFGTIHVGKGPVGHLHPAAAKALDGADGVYTEVPMDMATQVGLAQHFIRKDGRTLADSIGADLSAKLEVELKAIQPALNSKVLQPFKTWAVAVTLPMLKQQLEGGQPLDMIVWQKAEAAGKSTGALEKPADQFAIFDDLTEEEQVILLSESVRLQKAARTQGDDPIGELIAAYVSGDEAKLAVEMEKQFREMSEGKHAELGKKLLKKLLDDRNATMAATIAGHLAAAPDRSHFFAVGTGHYLGSNSIGEHLTRKGYKVTRVTE